MESRTQARALTSQTDITNAVAAGDVTIQKTPIIVECSVMFTPGGGVLPRARIKGTTIGKANQATIR